MANIDRCAWFSSPCEDGAKLLRMRAVFRVPTRRAPGTGSGSGAGRLQLAPARIDVRQQCAQHFAEWRGFAHTALLAGLHGRHRAVALPRQSARFRRDLGLDRFCQSASSSRRPARIFVVFAADDLRTGRSCADAASFRNWRRHLDHFDPHRMNGAALDFDKRCSCRSETMPMPLSIVKRPLASSIR